MGHFGGILGSFGEFFGFWDNFKILYFFIFFRFKKIMFEKKSDQKTISCVKYEYGPLIHYVFFTFEIFMFFSCSSGSHHNLEISFNLNDYFSFTTTTLDSVNVKILTNLKQKLFLWIFFQNTSHFHTNWLIFEGLPSDRLP
jgi:hypothetical protein